MDASQSTTADDGQLPRSSNARNGRELHKFTPHFPDGRRDEIADKGVFGLGISDFMNFNAPSGFRVTLLATHGPASDSMDDSH